MKRTLLLKRESLTALSARDLNTVVGAAMSNAATRCTIDNTYLHCSILCQNTYGTC